MKEKFIKSTFILLIGGFLTKILGMFIKIVMGRMIGTEGLGLYMMILPTFSLFISLSQFGMPTALIKLVASNRSNNKKLFFSTLLVSLSINICLIIFIIFFAEFLSNDLLHNKNTYYGILAIALVIPFTSISSLCRSYFFGKEKMIPHVTSNIIEDIVRLLLIVIGVPFFYDKSISYTVCYLILSNVVSESISIIVLLLFLPKKVIITKDDLRPSKNYIKESLSIGIPNTCGRFIGSIGYFLEPIILTNVLISVGYSSEFITYEYGVLSGYVMPLLLLPSFFTMAISQALFPLVAKDFSNYRFESAKKKIKLAITFSLAIGIPISLMFFFYPDFFLKLIYHTTEGISYIKFLVFICLLQYIQAPLSVSLDAMGKSKDVMISSIIGVGIRTSMLFLLSFLKIGLWGLILSISLNVIAVTLYLMKKVSYYLNR